MDLEEKIKKLESLAWLVAHVDGISEDAVDFRDTYDSEEVEPVVLPAGFVFKQPDLGTSIILIATLFVLFTVLNLIKFNLIKRH